MNGLASPRNRPCPSCPYRQDVPSDIWEAHEYEKLAFDHAHILTDALRMLKGGVLQC